MNFTIKSINSRSIATNALIYSLALPLSFSANAFDAYPVELPPLLLAKDFQVDTDISQFLVSEKLDGIRVFWNGQKLLTRRGFEINAPIWFTKNFPNEALDGELWIERGKFEEVSRIARTKKPANRDWFKMKFMAFDLPYSLDTFAARHQRLEQLVTASPSSYLHLVRQIKIKNRDELESLLQTTIAKGGEGLMLHKLNSIYQAKRSFDLQKLKPFDDAEATVINHLGGKGKYAGLMGAIEVINDEGVRFKIGSGFNLQERKNPPAIDSRITYRYRGKTRKNTPRFATFLRQKNEEIE